MNLTAAYRTESNFEEQILGSEKNGEIIMGAFERASGGTLVVDELSDLTEAAQKVLLGAIQDGQFTRVGAAAPVKIDARIVATVSADYEALIEKGSYAVTWCRISVCSACVCRHCASTRRMCPNSLPTI